MSAHLPPTEAPPPARAPPPCLPPAPPRRKPAPRHEGTGRGHGTSRERHDESAAASRQPGGASLRLCDVDDEAGHGEGRAGRAAKPSPGPAPGEQRCRRAGRRVARRPRPPPRGPRIAARRRRPAPEFGGAVSSKASGRLLGAAALCTLPTPARRAAPAPVQQHDDAAALDRESSQLRSPRRAPDGARRRRRPRHERSRFVVGLHQGTLVAAASDRASTRARRAAVRRARRRRRRRAVDVEQNGDLGQVRGVGRRAVLARP